MHTHNVCFFLSLSHIFSGLFLFNDLCFCMHFLSIHFHCVCSVVNNVKFNILNYVCVLYMKVSHSRNAKLMAISFLCAPIFFDTENALPHISVGSHTINRKCVQNDEHKNTRIGHRIQHDPLIVHIFCCCCCCC